MAFKPPVAFNFRDKAAWPEWRARWNRFYNLQELSSKTQEAQVDAFIYTMGKEAESQFNRFQFTDEQKKSYKHVFDTFDAYLTPQRNVIHERATFGKRHQRDGESVHDYVQDLYELSTYCEFPNKEDAIRDRLVLGLRDPDVSEKLQLESELTLEKAIKIAKQKELVQQQVQIQRSEGASASLSVDFAGRAKGRGGRGNPRGNFRFNQSQKTQDNCTRCGGSHNASCVCPAKGKLCRKCNKLSHLLKCADPSRSTL